MTIITTTNMFVADMSAWRDFEEAQAAGLFLEVAVIEGVLCDDYLGEIEDPDTFEFMGMSAHGARYIELRQQAVSPWANEYKIIMHSDVNRVAQFEEARQAQAEEMKEV